LKNEKSIQQGSQSHYIGFDFVQS